MSIDSEGRAALDSLDRALAARPKQDGTAFAAATEHLCAMRALVAGRCRPGGAVLARLNAIISIALAGHFPLGGVPWPAIEQARAALQVLIAELDGDAGLTSA